MSATNQAPAIELIGIDKKFGAVHANKNINLTVAKGSIHGIIGENSAMPPMTAPSATALLVERGASLRAYNTFGLPATR